MSLDHLYNRTVEVYRVEEDYKGRGEYEENYVNQNRDFKCRIYPTEGKTRGSFEGGKQEKDVSHRGVVPSGEDVRRGDILKDTSTNEQFRVINEEDPGGMGHHTELNLYEEQEKVIK